MRFCHPSALQMVRHQILLLKRRWFDVTTWAKQRETRLQEGETLLVDEQRLIEELMAWITSEEELLIESENVPLQDDYDTLHAMLEDVKRKLDDASSKQPDYDKVLKSAKKVPFEKKRVSAIKTPGRAHNVQGKEYLNPRVTQLAKRWQHLWLAQMDRLSKLQKKLDAIRIVSSRYLLTLLIKLLKWINVIQDTQRVLKLPQEQRA